MPKSSFGRNVLTLMTGTSIAQAIPIAVSPILTRLYTPQEFGIYGLFIALVAMISVIVTGRYELAIIQPRLSRNVDNLAVLSLVVCFFISLLCLALIFIFDTQLVQWLGEPSILPWLYFIPFCVFLTGCFQSLNYWHNRQKRYDNIAKAKVGQSGMMVSVNLAASPVNLSGFGLILGHLLGQLVAVLLLVKRALSERRRSLDPNKAKGWVNIKRSMVLAKRYRKFPQLSAPGALLDTASLQLPLLVISRLFDMAAVGFFNFTYRIIGGPLSLISGALAQVLLQKVATAQEQEIYPFVLLTLKRLSLVSIPFTALVFFYGETLFSIVFSETWRVAGQYASILIFSIAIRFIVTPLSMVLTLDRNIKLGVVWQVLYFISVVTTLYLARDLEVEGFLTAFVIQDVILYLVYLGFILIASKRMMICVE